jgi:non-specific serine/threonine protein kinase/serine/threonine-protein kinase
MKFVEGGNLAQHAGPCRDDPRAAARLVAQVARAVHHAHQRGLLHRDLKPSNLLVAEVGGRPLVKIIDFGLAKALQAGSPLDPLQTLDGHLLGTPEYMSPEQTRLENRDIDTRTDVYSLGMILYVLLVNDFPYDFDSLNRADGYDGMFRAIRELEPPPPSRRVASTTRRAGAKAISAVELRAKSKALNGELDWITLTALEKDPNLRYASPIDLAADIQRYLDDEPLSVGPPSVRYRLGKFVRRHRSQVAAAALVGIAVFGGVVSTGIGFARAVRAERVARDEAAHAAREADGAKRTKDLLVDVLQSPDPSVARGTTLDIRDVLQRGTERVLAGLTDQPLLLAQMMDVIGLVDTNLGSYEEATRLLTEALTVSATNSMRFHRLGCETRGVRAGAG